MTTYYSLDKAVAALREVLQDCAEEPYSARCADFTDGQIQAGELKAADAEAEQQNLEVYRQAVGLGIK